MFQGADGADHEVACVPPACSLEGGRRRGEERQAKSSAEGGVHEIPTGTADVVACR